MPKTPEISPYWDPKADGGENPTPGALGDLLVNAVRQQKVGVKPQIVYLSPEGAKEINNAGINIDKATQAVTNITGVAVGISRR